MGPCAPVGSVRARYLVFFQYLGTNFKSGRTLTETHAAGADAAVNPLALLSAVGSRP